MARVPRHPLRLPPLFPDIQWGAVWVSTFTNTHTIFDWYYFIVTAGNNTSSHAGRFGRDWASGIRGSRYFHFMPSGWSINVTQSHLWDGFTHHTYPNQLFAQASLTGPFAGQNVGVSYTLRHRGPDYGNPNIIGRKFWSPIPLEAINGNRLVEPWLTRYQQIGQTLFETIFISEGVHYFPAVLSETKNLLAPIDSFEMLQSPRPLRRRARSTAGVAEYPAPLAYPTSDG